MITIRRTAMHMEREPLARPFGFKGSRLTELWQSAVLLESRSGARGLGLGTQSVLWSDAALFAAAGENTANRRMAELTAYAAREAARRGFTHPMELFEALFPATWSRGKSLTGRRSLRPTVALNALVAVDTAAWLLYAAERGVASFDALIPPAYRAALGARNRRLADIPLLTYGLPASQLDRLVQAGTGLLKIKIGADPDGDGDRAKMLDWDKRRLAAIHAAVGGRRTPLTADGRIRYYLDANGRYDSKARLLRLLDHAASIGALDRIALIEEPFPESFRADVRDVPVCLAADESAPTESEARARMDMGYGVLALKPAAKTLSMTLSIARAAHARGVPCLCADLTVNPVLLEWNRNVAARLEPLPGLTAGALEANGRWHYRDWPRLCRYHPRSGAAWTRVRRGRFELGSDFYAHSGGLFEPSLHYLELAERGGRRAAAQPAGSRAGCGPRAGRAS